MTYQSVNPADGKVLKTFKDTHRQGTRDARSRPPRPASRPGGTRPMPSGRRSSPKPPPCMHEKVDELAHIMTLEMGKRINEARGEVEFSSSILAYYAKNAERFLANVELHPSLGRRPYGEQPARRGLLRRALELSLLPARPGRRSAFDGRQRPVGEACRHRAAMRDRLREALDRGGRACRALHQSPDLA